MDIFSHILVWDSLADRPIEWDDIAERRMEPELRPIHRLAQIWGQTEYRGGIPRAAPGRNPIARMMEFGPIGAAYSGPPRAERMTPELEVFEACVMFLPGPEHVAYFRNHYCDLPGARGAEERLAHLVEHYPIKCGSLDTYQRRMTMVRRALLQQYAAIWVEYDLSARIAQSRQWRAEWSENELASRRKRRQGMQESLARPLHG